MQLTKELKVKKLTEEFSIPKEGLMKVLADVLKDVADKAKIEVMFLHVLCPVDVQGIDGFRLKK